MMSKNSKLSSCEKYSHMIHENVETGEITFDKGVPQEAIDGYKYWAKQTNSTYEEWVKECRKNVMVNMRMMRFWMMVLMSRKL